MGASSASNANVTFRYTGTAASPVIYAALGTGWHYGATSTYYGTYGGTLTVDLGSASSPTLHCGAIIGRLSGNAESIANLGDSTHPVTILSTANINGRTPSADTSSPNYYKSAGFLVGLKDAGSTPTLNITNVVLQ